MAARLTRLTLIVAAFRAINAVPANAHFWMLPDL
jgi:hypothetical protein